MALRPAVGLFPALRAAGPDVLSALKGQAGNPRVAAAWRDLAYHW